MGCRQFWRSLAQVVGMGIEASGLARNSFAPDIQMKFVFLASLDGTTLRGRGDTAKMPG